jgi:hypothetical protein
MLRHVDIDKQNGLIRDGLAHNAHRLLSQYAELDLPEERRYDVTLCLCVTQMLLANSVELAIATNNQKKRAEWLQPLVDPVARVLTYPGAVEQSTFPAGTPDTIRVLTHLRNALSHPRMTHTNPPTTTGYTTNSDHLGVITSVTFTDSPDYNNKGTLKPKEFRSPDKGEVYVGAPRIFTIRLDVQQLLSLARALADRLREGVPENISAEISVDRATTLAR